MSGAPKARAGTSGRSMLDRTHRQPKDEHVDSARQQGIAGQKGADSSNYERDAARVVGRSRSPMSQALPSRISAPERQNSASAVLAASGATAPAANASTAKTIPRMAPVLIA